MNMTEKTAKNEMESSIEKVKNRLIPSQGEVSLMYRKGPSSFKNPIEVLPAYQKKKISDSDEFPSLLNN